MPYDIGHVGHLKSSKIPRNGETEESVCQDDFRCTLETYSEGAQLRTIGV